jgi:HK97 family phage major capsid protein
MSMRKQIDALQKKRNAHLDAMTALADTVANDNRLFNEDEQKAWDKDQGEVRDIDAQLIRLGEAERQIAERATPAPAPGGTTAKVIPFKSFPAQSFTRYVMALASGKGNLVQALEISKRWEHQTPEVAEILRAAVAAGTTTDPVWAAPLVNYQIMASEFIDLLRPETIFGKMSGFRTVPFNVKIPRQTAGATANWVGEGQSKPVNKLAFDMVTVPWAKMAVIVVITQELARFSNPSAEMLVRDDLISAIAQFIDEQLIDPTVAPVAALKPGSITNGVTPIPSTGADYVAITTDLTHAMIRMVNALNTIGRPVWIMSPAAAMFIATLRLPQGQFAFPGMTSAMIGGQMGGLTLMGIPVIVSGNVPVTGGLSNILLVDQSQIMLADDGQVMIDTSVEASLQLDSAPATPPAPLVSLWQQNLLGIKAERFMYWMRRRDAGVQLITGFPEGGTLPTMSETLEHVDPVPAPPPAPLQDGVTGTRT